ncbi:helix-turn-helix domain-containing protein [Virgibacillus soli]|uniref:Helix-turn-helix transcriptional regulator n=1 Tax=Paracerasibacillus soli TaxID=480284 RepID=A0ABU5CW26_9BACI|nr:helix-turn-helix transcriptional regulator [Virgibacillus soli]MDY0410022.1 helix-turn-helix transcriptional regulator [Virgibacillus soli]
MESKRLGLRIKAFRKLKRYTQKEFADKLHVSLSILGKVERGMMEPSPSLLETIAQVLEIDVKEIMQTDK